MHLFVMSFSGRRAEGFFETLLERGINIMVDIRLKNQLSTDGFTHKDDLVYFLNKLCSIPYEHDLMLAPTENQYEAFERGTKAQPQYFAAYRRLLEGRQAVAVFLSRYARYENICFLVGKDTASSYVDILTEMISERKPEVTVTIL